MAHFKQTHLKGYLEPVKMDMIQAKLMVSVINTNRSSLMVALALILLAVLLGGCGEAVSQASSRAADLDQTQSKSQEKQPAPVLNEATLEPEPAGEIHLGDSPIATPGGPLKQETRAIWAKVSRNRKVSKADMDELVAKVDAAHLNVIFLAVYKGAAYFEPSHTRFPESATRLANQSNFEDDAYPDPLSYLLAIRDERRTDDNPFNDFEVHAWFNVNQGGDQEDGWPPTDETEATMLNALFPEFKLKHGDYYLRADERYVDHAISVVHQPRFRAYMTDLVAGLVEDYDVDGVHLDHIRTGGLCFNDEFLDYAGTEYDYPGCQEAYKAWTRETYGREYTLWEDTDGRKNIKDGARERVAAWQQRAVGLLVKSIHDEVKTVKPEIIISVASVRNDTSQTNMRQLIDGQAAWEWLDQGWIDAIFSTAYAADTQAVVNKIQIVRQAVQVEGRRSSVFPGLITYNSDDPTDLWSALVVEQVNAAMFGQWADGQPLEPPAKGVALFVNERLSQKAARALGEGPFKEPARPFWGS